MQMFCFEICFIFLLKGEKYRMCIIANGPVSELLYRNFQLDYY